MQYTLITQLLSQKREFLFRDGEIDQEIVAALVAVEDESYDVLMSLSLRKPSLIQVLSILPGSLDNLLLGKYVKMFFKNITLGGLGIWWVKDILSAKSRCMAYNRKRFLTAINNPDIAKRIISAEEKAKLAIDYTAKVAPSVLKGIKEIQDTFYVN